MSANIMERLREALAAAQNFRGDLDGDDFEDVCAGLRFSATQAAPSLLAQLDAHAAEITRLRAALAQAGAPEGWQLVPVEPTPWMLQALFGYWMDCINNPKQRNVAKAEYKAMLTAAEALPHHPSPAQREPLSDAQVLACVRSVGVPAPMGLTRDRGPYEVTEPTWFLTELVRAIERAHGITTSGTKGAAS